MASICDGKSDAAVASFVGGVSDADFAFDAYTVRRNET
jgi:hypothetical protein